MTNATTSPPQYVTVDEIATELRIHRMTVYRAIDRGELKAIRINNRTYRIPAESYAEYKTRLHADADARVAAASAVAGPGQITVCVCGDPAAQSVVHRTDGPCYAMTPA